MQGLPLNAVVGGKYRIEKLVGAGGMGEVYRAFDLQKKRPVAVKVLTLAGESGSALARFRNEAVIQWSLRHPNVAELYEYFVYQGRPCIAMEFVEGRALSEWIRDAGALAPADALKILAEICDAVSYMHSKSTIHRDIKSENIKVNAHGTAKLLDFGISVAKNTPVLTTEGHTIGTPGKMAPEQHTGSRGDTRSDVWALGVLLYEMVTGAPPFPNSDPTGVRDDVTAARYIPALKRKPDLPKPLVKMISTCLRLRPDERYASGGVMLREVQQLRRRLTGNEWQRTLLSAPALAAGGLTVAVVLLFAYAFRPAADVRGPGGNESPPPHSSPAISGTAPTPGLPNPAPEPASHEPARSHSGSTAVAPPAASVPAAAEIPANPTVDPNAADQKTVRVTTYDGPAEVTTTDGQVLGRTPYSLTGPFGKSYQLWLRREGFQPRKVDVEINNKNEYLFGLEKIEGHSDFGKRE